jgi:hypothetical protein
MYGVIYLRNHDFRYVISHADCVHSYEAPGLIEFNNWWFVESAFMLLIVLKS